MNVEITSTTRGIAVYVDGKRARKIGGSSRVVYLSGSIVIKIDWSCEEYNQSKREYEVWSRISGTKDAVWFVPVRGYGRCESKTENGYPLRGFWCAQDYVPVRRGFHVTSLWDSDEAYVAARRHGVGDLERNSNWAVIGDRPVVRDFGWPSGGWQ